MSRTTLVQDIADQVTCGICLEHFNVPKTVMPCLHNFCEGCLQGMIESTSNPTGIASADPTVYATFSFPCPSCRGAVEFPVRIPQPWVMKQIAQEAVKKEFKTNFQIKNQLDIINTKIKQGCQEHQGEIKMWFCKACKVNVCQFCVLQDHNSSEHETTPLNLEQKKQGLTHSKQQVLRQVAELESSCADMEGQLAYIHNTKGRFEDQKKLIMDEFVAVHNKLETMESQINSKQQNFIQQLTSSEMQILQVYQEASEDMEHYKTEVDELDRKLADADFGIGSLSDETDTETALKPMSIPVVEIPKRPEISLDLLQNGMLGIKEILVNISRDLELSDIEAEPGSASKNDLTNLPLENERALTPVGMQAPQIQQQHPQQQLTARMLAQASQNEQRQMLGERFYPIIYQMHGELAGKITGMLLEIDKTELLHMLESGESLVSKVKEAVEVLQAWQSEKTNPVKTSSPKLCDESQSDDNTLATVTRLLGSMFAKKKCSNKQILDWIETNIDVQLRRQNIFIRALVAIVCRSSSKESSRPPRLLRRACVTVYIDESNRCDPDLLKSRARLLPRYIDGDFTKELQVLFAVQELNHKLNNPPGLLRLIFDIFYDEDVISEEALFSWRESDDPNEQIGKDEALASVEDYFV